MPKPIVVLMTWIHQNPLDMAALATGVAQKLSQNSAMFPSPPVTPSDLSAAANAVTAAYANRMNGPAAKTALDQADAELDEILHIEAAYVNTIANGDKATIEISGFTATSDSRKPATVPDTPDAPKISGNASALHLETNNSSADSFCWLIFTDTPVTPSVSGTHITLPAAPVIVIPNGHFREDLLNVIPAGAKIAVQVLAQNTAGKSGFSPLVTFMVGS